MEEKPSAGQLFGIPYNFDRPSMGRLLAAHWQPDKGMFVEKPFGIGYTLNLANWRSWIVIAVAGGLYWQSQQSASRSSATETDEEPVEVIVDGN